MGKDHNSYEVKGALIIVMGKGHNIYEVKGALVVAMARVIIALR